MAATHFLIAKFIAVSQRRESRNFGVRVWSNGQFASKFAGEETTRIDKTRVRPPSHLPVESAPENRQWFRRLANTSCGRAILGAVFVLMLTRGLPVQAADEVSGQTDVENVAGLHVGTLRVGKVLFLGNSITLHGPAPKIGWTGNWGMAATAREKDYVHLLLDRITKAAGGKPVVMVKNIADFERGLTDYNLPVGLKDELAFEADLIVIAIGENASAPKTDADKARFADAYARLFAEFKKHGRPTLIARSQFWADAAKDQILKQTCQDAGGLFVDQSKLGIEANYARAERKIEHAGVAGHPGDKGMQAIAESLWNAIQKHAGLNPH